jgi:hypothetical protein
VEEEGNLESTQLRHIQEDNVQKEDITQIEG